MVPVWHYVSVAIVVCFVGIAGHISKSGRNSGCNHWSREHILMPFFKSPFIYFWISDVTFHWYTPLLPQYSHLMDASSIFSLFPGKRRGFDSLWRFCDHNPPAKKPSLVPSPFPSAHQLTCAFFCFTDRPNPLGRPLPFSVKKFAKLALGVQSLRFTALSGRFQRKKWCLLWTVHSDLTGDFLCDEGLLFSTCFTA